MHMSIHKLSMHKANKFKARISGVNSTINFRDIHKLLVTIFCCELVVTKGTIFVNNASFLNAAIIAECVKCLNTAHC